METERASSRLNYNITCGINKNVNTTCRCLDFRAPSSNLLLLVSFFSMFSFSFLSPTPSPSHISIDNFRITLVIHQNPSQPTDHKKPHIHNHCFNLMREGGRERFAFLTDQKQLYSFMVNSLGFWESRSKSQIPIFPYNKIQTQQRFSIMTIIIPIKHG